MMSVTVHCPFPCILVNRHLFQAPGYQDIVGAKVALGDGRWSGYVRRDGRFTM
jgi:hypothetical protein